MSVFVKLHKFSLTLSVYFQLANAWEKSSKCKIHNRQLSVVRGHKSCATTEKVETRL